MHRIKEMLMKELKEYESKGKLSAGDLETIHKLTDTVKNIDKIEMLEGGEGYSEDGMSYDGAKEHLMRKLGEMMPMAESEEQRKALEHCMRKIEDA